MNLTIKSLSQFVGFSLNYLALVIIGLKWSILIDVLLPLEKENGPNFLE